MAMGRQRPSCLPRQMIDRIPRKSAKSCMPPGFVEMPRTIAEAAEIS
jgi:hypothetical protein